MENLKEVIDNELNNIEDPLNMDNLKKDLNEIKNNDLKDCDDCVDCFICCEKIEPDKYFKCEHCDFLNCIDCHKKYLLDSPNEPHCIKCRTIIAYDEFILKFNDKQWIFKKYKPHKEKNLWDKEQLLFQDTIALIAKNKTIKALNDKLVLEHEVYRKELAPIQEQIRLLNLKIGVVYKNHKDITRPIETQLQELYTKKTIQKFQYTHKCPGANCMGFLNSKFICDLCDVSVCRKCYLICENEGNHECKQEDVDTFNQIKKEAKPCPTCGEYISKISGCDQMFCTYCGSAFSWKTGLIEKGIIHNPHAHTYFQNNEQARNMYVNNLNNNNGENCRIPVPLRTTLDKKFIQVEKKNRIFTIWIYVNEFRQYYRNNYIQKVETNVDINNDIRMRFINKEIPLKQFKSLLHARDKKSLYLKQVCNLLISTFNIAELFLWEIAILPQINNTIGNVKGFDVEKQIENNINIDKRACDIYDNMLNLITDTNKNLLNISTSFQYNSSYKLKNDYSGYPRKVDQL